jgi:Phage stabilisation protein
LPFTNGFYQSRSRPLSSQRCVNWYPQSNTSPALTQDNLYPTSGITQVVSGLDGLGRGAHVWNGTLYVVCGQRLYKILRVQNPDGSGETFIPSEVGFIRGDVDVIMVSTKSQLCILVPDPSATTEDNAYIYDGSAITDITAEANFLAPAISAVAIDSYFVFAQHNTRFIFHSNLNDGTTFNAVDAWEIQQFPKCNALVVFQNNLYVMGESATIPFYNAEDPEFAFRPSPNSVIDSGVAGQYATTPFRGSFVYLGSGQNAERAVWLFNGGQPEKLSDNAIDFVIQNQAQEDIAAARLVRHSQNGAEFVALFVGDWCFVYDLVSARWHERRSLIPFEGGYIDAPWRVKHIIQAHNRVMVTDSNLGSLGVLDDTIHTEYGIRMRSYFITQPFMNQGQRIRVPALEVYCDVGNADGENLQLEWSDDGGFNYSNTMSRKIGGAGEYGRRVVFDRLGAVPNTRMLKVSYDGAKAMSINALMATTL